MSLEEAVLRTERAMDDHYRAREYLDGAIEDLEESLEGAPGYEESFEQFADTVAEYLESDRERKAHQAARIEELAETLEDMSAGQYPGMDSWGWGLWDGQFMNAWMQGQWNNPWSFDRPWFSGYRSDFEDNFEQDPAGSWKGGQGSGYGWDSWGNGAQFQAPGMQFQYAWF